MKILGSLKTPKKVEKKKEEAPPAEEGKPKEKKAKKVKEEPVMQYINIDRWMKHLEAKVPAYKKGVDAVVAIKNSQGKKGGAMLKVEKVKNAVTRFPPEPSGYLHIGHIKAAILNSRFAEENDGKLIVRFDDTNPNKEKQEFEDSIIEDLQLAGIKPDILSYTSNYFDQLYNFALQMIKEGKAYCDDTEQLQMRDERMSKKPSGRRDRSVEENLRIFEEMKNGTEEGKKNCLRAKISYDDNNGALRDPVIYRCNTDIPHHRTGTKWKMYPTYDFACPLVDSIENVTHALRTDEYNDRKPQYHWMIDALGLRQPEIKTFGRLNFIKTLLSKRKLTQLVDEKKVWGWDDPRFPTVRGIRRRGMTIEALKRFIGGQGFSEGSVSMDWSAIWAENKKVIDAVAPRHTALLKDGLVTAKIEGGPSPAVVEDRPKHKKNAEVGTKKLYLGHEIMLEQADAQASEEGEEVTLMDWGNAFITKVTKDDSGKVTSLELKLHLEGDFKKTKRKLTWLATAQKQIPVELVDFDHLLTKDKLEEGDDAMNFINPNTVFRDDAVADENVKDLEQGDIIQFERKGYYRLDEPYEEGKKAVFFCIPTGSKK